MSIAGQSQPDEPAPAGFDPLVARLRRLAGKGEATGAVVAEADRDDPLVEQVRLQALARAFSLSLFERQVLLLALGAEISPEIARLCVECLGDPTRPWPTFRLAIALFPGGDWRALTPGAALRRWDLIDLDPGPTLLDSPIRLREFALHWLCGESARDARLLDWLEPVAQSPTTLPASHAAIVVQAARALELAADRGGDAGVQLCCPDPHDALRIAAAAGDSLGWGVDRLRADSLPASRPERALLLRLMRREQALSRSLLVVELGEGERFERPDVLAEFLGELRAPVVISAPTPIVLAGFRTQVLSVAPPTAKEQVALWRARLARQPAETEALLASFRLRESAIEAAIAAAAGAAQAARPRRGAAAKADLVAHLPEACRAQLRGRLERFAQRIDARANLDDLILAPRQADMLATIIQDARNRDRVLARWTEGGGHARGLGLCALFTGPSGTGKTTAAEAIAHALELDLYRIDLSAVVSKYIGETEKQLNGLFDAAEEGASLLLFDECDALFGKRTEVRDSHDRYANQEISFLLQKLETYRGLAVLTSNLPDALDPAFLRRFRYIVEFPAPGLAEREQIWRRVLPPTVETGALDFTKLARLNLTGGHIRNVALQAAFHAAAEGGPVTMALLQHAAENEYRKLHRVLTDYETDD